MKHISNNWIEFNHDFGGIDESGNKCEFHHVVQTSDYARTRLMKDYGRYAYNRMREENIKPMHIEVDGEVLYHVGKKGGGEGRKVCRI